MSELSLRTRIDELEIELEKRELEIDSYLGKVEQLEYKIMRLEALTSNNVVKKKKKGTPSDSKIVVVLDTKEKEIRELKDKMGFLRKEKVQLLQKVEQLSRNGNSSVIRIEQKKSPLDSLITELQTKINKQNLIIAKLKQQSTGSNELNELINKQEKEIKSLKAEIQEKNEQIDKLSLTTTLSHDGLIKKSLTEDLQKNLKKARSQISFFKERLALYEKIESRGDGSEAVLTIELKAPESQAQFENVSQKDMALKIIEMEKLIKELRVENSQNKIEISRLKVESSKN